MAKATLTPSKKSIEQISELSLAAYSGRLPWADKAIRAAGYSRGLGEEMPGTALARLWGISAMSISQWYRRDGCPRLASGRYSLPAVIKWREERARKAADPDGMMDGGGDAKTRYQTAKATMAELDLAERRAELVDVSKVTEEGVVKVRAVRRAMESYPRRCARRVAEEAGLTDPWKIEEILREGVDAICRAFSEGKAELEAEAALSADATPEGGKA